MIKNKVLFYLLPFVFIILLFSCASPGQLTGGPKDETAPTIETTYPDNKTTNINPRDITIQFDEPIGVNNIEKNLFISPYIDNPYKYKVKKNKLTLSFDNPFEPNTTYTLFFNNSIHDLTEKNTTKNVKYIFSTGNFIDSLQLEITVNKPIINKLCDNCIVTMYRVSDTNTITNSKPLYFGYTNEKGKTTISNIKNGWYSSFSYVDENNNFKYDENESIAYSDSIIKLDSTDEDITQQLISKDNRKQKILHNKNFGDTYRLQLSKGIKKLTFTDTNYINLNINHWFSRSNEIYLDNELGYPTGILILQDSINQIDTINLDLKKDTSTQYIDLLNNQIKLKPKDQIKIVLTAKANLIVDSLLYFISDSIKVNNNGWKMDSIRNMLLIDQPKGLITYTLHIDSLCIQNVKYSSKHFQKTYHKLDDVETGIISGRINCKGNTILQLMDNGLKVLEEIENPKYFKFEYLEPTTYQLRVIIDKNKNRKWDEGNFEKRIQPEQVFFHTGSINLRKNWEIKDNNISCPSK